MNTYILLILSLSLFSETTNPLQKKWVAYHGQPIEIKYYKNVDKYRGHRSSNDDVHFKLKIADTPGDLTTGEIENGIKIDFIDSLQKTVQPANLGFIHYSKSRDVKTTKEKALLEPVISLRRHGSLVDITVPIRRRINNASGEGIVGYRFPVGRCSIRITVLTGEDKQELLIPVIIK